MKYWLILFLLFSGCVKKPVKSKAIFAVIKTKAFRFADSGFLYKNGSVVLDLYEVSKPILRLKLSNRVCVNKMCMSYKMFNKNFLSSFYPDKLIKKILLKEAIFNGENLIKIDGGFVQKIASAHLDIIYIVKDRSIYFKDKKNKILIKIKEIDV